MIDRNGQQLGNYRIIRPIGSGGFANVYLGEHIYLQTQVAIKLLQTRLAEEEMEEFLKEARTIAHLIHPHIVRVLDFGTEGGTPFLVMDYAHNGTLRQLHPKGTRLPLDTVVSHMKQVAEALQHAHGKKLIHRDIKPENMLLAENRQILLSDFGIALIAQSTRYQNTQEVIGTAAYMAPEQLQGKPRQASDQYSLAIVVYEWLCGDRPFHGSFTEIYSQHLFVSPPSLHEKVPELPPTVEEVILTALAKDPKERFATIQAFAIALEQACQIAPFSSSPDLLTSSQLLSLTPMVTTYPPDQRAIPTDAVASVLSTAKVIPLTPSAGASSASHLPRSENTVPAPQARRKVAITNHYQDFQIKRVVLFIGLILLVLLEGSRLFTLMRVNQIATDRANATRTVATLVQAKHATATVQALVAATVTATIAYNTYVQATSGTPVVDDPLRDNSKGNNWVEGACCRFSGGAYHITMKFGLQTAYIGPTFSNFAVQVQMTILKGGYGGIIFRVNPKEVFGYRFVMRSDQSPYGGSDLAYGFGVHQTLARFPAIRAHLNQAYLLTAIVRGKNISLYINKQLVMAVEDSSADSGHIGFLAGSDDNIADVMFHDAKIWVL